MLSRHLSAAHRESKIMLMNGLVLLDNHGTLLLNRHVMQHTVRADHLHTEDPARRPKGLIQKEVEVTSSC